MEIYVCHFFVDYFHLNYHVCCFMLSFASFIYLYYFFLVSKFSISLPSNRASSGYISALFFLVICHLPSVSAFLCTLFISFANSCFVHVDAGVPVSVPSAVVPSAAHIMLMALLDVEGIKGASTILVIVEQ